MSAKHFISAALTIALIIAVQYLVGWQALLAPWAAVSMTDVLAAVLLVLLSYGLRVARLMDWFHPVRPVPATKVMLQHNLWNNLLPMRSGELSFPLLLFAYLDIPAARSIMALAWFRVLDLWCIVLILVLTWAWLTGQMVVMPIAVLMFVAALMALGPLLTRLMPLLVNLALQVVPARWRQALPASTAGWSQELIDTLYFATPRQWRCLGWSLANWLIKLPAFGYILMLFADTSLTVGIVGAIGGELTSVLPVHGVAGAGTYEAGIVLLLRGVEVDVAVALAAGVNLHLFLLSITLVTGIGSHFLPSPGNRQPPAAN